MNAPRADDQSTRRTLLRCAKFNVEAITLPGRDGTPIERQVIRHPGAVVILPILETTGNPRRVVFIRNRRVAVGKQLLELPAGTLEPGEDPALTAARELEEETGYAAQEIIPLGRFYTTPGMTDELMHAYAATGLREVGQRLEADEEIEVELLDEHEAIAAANNGRLEDGKSMLAVLLAETRGMIRNSGGVRA